MSNDYIQVFTTTDKNEDAKRIAKEVVEKRLIACAQIVGPISSTFWWDGKVDEEQEWLLIMKTRKALYDELERAIKNVHPYDVPEIIAQDIINGNRDYLDWIDKETTTKKGE